MLAEDSPHNDCSMPTDDPVTTIQGVQLNDVTMMATLQGVPDLTAMRDHVITMPGVFNGRDEDNSMTSQ